MSSNIEPRATYKSIQALIEEQQRDGIPSELAVEQERDKAEAAEVESAIENLLEELSSATSTPHIQKLQAAIDVKQKRLAAVKVAIDNRARVIAQHRARLERREQDIEQAWSFLAYNVTIWPPRRENYSPEEKRAAERERHEYELQSSYQQLARAEYEVFRRPPIGGLHGTRYFEEKARELRQTIRRLEREQARFANEVRAAE